MLTDRKTPHLHPPNLPLPPHSHVDRLFQLKMLELARAHLSGEQELALTQALVNINSYFPSRIQESAPHDHLLPRPVPPHPPVPKDTVTKTHDWVFKKSPRSKALARHLTSTPSAASLASRFDFYSMDLDQLRLAVPDQEFFDELLTVFTCSLILALLTDVHILGNEATFRVVDMLTDQDALLLKAKKKNFLAKKLVEGTLVKQPTFRDTVLRVAKRLILKEHLLSCSAASSRAADFPSLLKHIQTQTAKQGPLTTCGYLIRLLCQFFSVPINIYWVDRADRREGESYDCEREAGRKAKIVCLLGRILDESDSAPGMSPSAHSHSLCEPKEWWLGIGVKPIRERIRLMGQDKRTSPPHDIDQRSPNSHSRVDSSAAALGQRQSFGDIQSHKEISPKRLGFRTQSKTKDSSLHISESLNKSLGPIPQVDPPYSPGHSATPILAAARVNSNHVSDILRRDLVPPLALPKSHNLPTNLSPPLHSFRLVQPTAWRASVTNESLQQLSPPRLSSHPRGPAQQAANDVTLVPTLPDITVDISQPVLPALLLPLPPADDPDPLPLSTSLKTKPAPNMQTVTSDNPYALPSTTPNTSPPVPPAPAWLPTCSGSPCRNRCPRCSRAVSNADCGTGAAISNWRRTPTR